MTRKQFLLLLIAFLVLGVSVATAMIAAGVLSLLANGLPMTIMAELESLWGDEAA